MPGAGERGRGLNVQAGSGPILIAGGGIGGLTLSLALAKWGRRSRILEARDTFSEAGAGIQLGPNATRLLRDFGIATGLGRSAVSPEGIHVRDGISGQFLADLPLGSWIESRHGAPYLVTHRADLQSALLDAVRASPLIEISNGFRVEAISEDAAGVHVRNSDGTVATGPILVGADGIWSRIRTLLHPDFALTYSGTAATRAILPMSEVPTEQRALRTGVWLAPSAHIVHYPVRGGDALAIVVITSDPDPGVGWGIPVSAESVMSHVTGFDSSVRLLLSRADDWHRWALFNPKPLRRWSRGRVTLLGDAAHPILPFLAQGGAMAIEDAAVLGWEIARGYGTYTHIFQAYEDQRITRVTQVQKSSRDNGTAYHLSGIAATTRNLALASAPTNMIMQRYDWIYGWQHDMEYGEVEL
ncbi:MAG: FAD-dependent monooxygenase [Hyphomicrobiaceae bacterium]|nr:FAD-dependent monooxygenase [Hyphomicrobiaceae bacterium]